MFLELRVLAACSKIILAAFPQVLVYIRLRMTDICVIVISTNWISLLTIILDITYFRVFSQFFSYVFSLCLEFTLKATFY